MEQRVPKGASDDYKGMLKKQPKQLHEMTTFSHFVGEVAKGCRNATWQLGEKQEKTICKA